MTKGKVPVGGHPGCPWVLSYSKKGSSAKYKYFKKKSTATKARDAMVKKAVREDKSINTSIRKRGTW